MTFVNTPSIGQWYSDIQHRYFEVVAVNDGDIEIQFIDGDVGEIEAETWLQLQPTTADEPRDGRGPFEGSDMDNSETISDWQDNEFQQNGWQGFLDKW